MREETLKLQIMTEDQRSNIEESEVNESTLEILNKWDSIQVKKQISWNESSEEIPASEEDDDSVYILNGVVDGFWRQSAPHLQNILTKNEVLENKTQLERLGINIGEKMIQTFLV